MSNTTTHTATHRDLAPSGWYPDPTGSSKLRWWDGQHWSERTEFPNPALQPTFSYSPGELSVTRQHDYL